MEVKTAAVTVSVAEPWIAPEVAVMVAPPDARLVASPVLLTVAIDAADEVQAAVMVRSCVLLLL
jgi:hypothetical protein